MEGRVDHAQWGEDPLLEKLLERQARDLADQVTQHVGRDRIVPGRTGRELERHPRQFVDETVQTVRPFEGVDLGAAVSGIDVRARLEAIGQAGGVSQQVDHAHWRFRAPGLEAARQAGEVHTQVAPGRNEAVHGIVQRDQPFFDQHHERDARDRLGHRVDAHDAVFRQRCPGLDRRLAEHRLVHPSALARDVQQGARQLARQHVLLGQESVQPGQAFRAHAQGFRLGSHVRLQ
jgi:hypothetical protein